MSNEKRRLVLVDGNAILHRAYHALPPLTTRSGELVNAVYGFASMLFKIFSDLHPEYIAVAFDTAGPNFRHQEYIGYKANRPKTDLELTGQIDRVHQLVKAFNIPILEVKGYEADDVIGTLARQAAEVKNSTPRLRSGQEFKVNDVIIVTGDKDLMQLVNDEVKLYMPSRGLSDGQIIGTKEVKEKMGIPPDKIVDYKGLAGDQSDNYPGVPGIGPKTAIELLSRFGDVEGIYMAIRNVGGVREIGSEATVKKLAEGAESAVLSKRLATILTDVPIKLKLEDCVTKDFDKEKVLSLFKELGFRSLAGRLTGEKRDEDPTLSRKAGVRGASNGQGSLF